jgi:hypothetical protein
MRTAIIRVGFGDPAEMVRRVGNYLPANYWATYDRARDCIVITGSDVAGWTLDGFVVPRLASGFIFATETHQ